jgi:YidC/Oxa1 family membrane protein insertase
MIRTTANSIVRRHFVAKGCSARVVVPASSASCDWKTDREENQQQQQRQQQQRARISSFVAASTHPKIFDGSARKHNVTPQRRFLSTTDSSSSASTTTAAIGEQQVNNFEDTMDKIFTQSQKVAATEGDKWFVDEALTQEAWDPKWWNFADQAINVVNFVDELTGFGYAASILVTTVTLRAFIFPLAVRGQRASSRMAHLQPELASIKQRYEALGTPSGAEQKAFAENMKALFARYEVTPFAALATPLIQAPMFIGMFFGMKKIPDLFPEQCANGGLWWFTDLTVADPTYVLPLLCGISFIATIESGKDQMIDSNPQHGPVIVNVFRAMAVVMVPVITTFPAAMLCYWVPNNFITMCQSMILRNDMVKQQFGIWDRPKPVPGAAQEAGFQETMNNLVKQVKGEPTTEKAKIELHNKEMETRKRVKEVSKAARASRR